MKSLSRKTQERGSKSPLCDKNTIHKKLAITTHSWHCNEKIKDTFVGEFKVTYRGSNRGVQGGSQKNLRIITEHLERPSLGNWGSWYADIQYDQNSGNKSSQTQDTAVPIATSNSIRLKQTVKTWKYQQRL